MTTKNQFTAVYRKTKNWFVAWVEEIPGVLPTAFALGQNYPNPFNPSTTFEFELFSTEIATIKVFDILGREVATLLNERLTPGRYRSTWDASHYASGMYVYRLTAGQFTSTRRMVLLK